MPYFNTSNDDHTRLLPDKVARQDDLTLLVEEAEGDVIDHFTRRAPGNVLQKPVPGAVSREATQIGSSQFYVFLRGYEEDPANVDTTEFPNFKRDMAATIAKVIRWRSSQDKMNPVVQSAGDGQGKNERFRDDARRPFPPGWDRRLRKYTTLEPAWGW